MKNFKEIFLISLLTLLLGACSATNRLTMGAIEPAQVHLSSEITKVGILNRSVPSAGNEAIDKIDKVLSLEGLNLDREGAEAAVTGLSDELSRDDRFEAVKLIDAQDAQKKGLGVFPAALSWADVEEICRENEVDVLFSLEFYDTDTKVAYETTMVTIPNNLGINAKIPGHKVTLNTAIKNGWRIYDPVSKLLLDEFVGNDYITSVGEGINPVKAIEAVVGRKEAVLQVSSNIGNSYGLIIKPLRKRIARDYFVSGTDNFVMAKRRAQTGDWDGAAQLWEQELNNPKGKIAGRACYNMAIISEINGELEKALDWASKSYADYNNKEALRYINLLNRRLAENRELERQLAR
jgi:hypothetical protein